jgi:hypothetical protein
MARIPVYGTDTIDQAALPGVRQTGGATAEMFLNDGGIGALGKGLSALGAAGMDVLTRQKKTEDEAIMKQADIEYAGKIRTILHNPESGYLNALGEVAVKGREGVQKQIEEVNKEFRERYAQDPARARIWGNLEGVRTESAMGQIDVHSSRQLQVFAAGQAEARAKAQIPEMVANAGSEGRTDPETGRPVGPHAVARATLLSEIQIAGEKTGKSQAEIDNLKKAMLTDAHTQVVQDMVANKNAKGAEAYFKKYAEKGEILADRQAEIKKAIDNELVRTDGLNLSMEVGATVKGGETAQLAEVDKRYKAGDISAEVRDNAKQRIEHDFAKRRTQQHEYDKYNMGQAQDWVLKNSGKSIQEMPPALYNWAKNNGHLAGLDSFATREGRPGERMKEIKVRGEMITTAMAEPDKFIEEFKRTGFADRMDLGVQGIKEMQNIAGDMIKGNGKYKSEFDQKIMQDAIPKALLATGEKDNRDRFVALQHEAQMTWKKANPGKQPTLAEQQAVANSANADWVRLRSGPIWNADAKAYEVQGKPDIRAIPKAEYERIKAAGAKNNDEVWAVWQLKQKGAK